MRIRPQLLMMRARGLAGPFFHPWTRKGAPLVRGPGAYVSSNHNGPAPEAFVPYTIDWADIALGQPVANAAGQNGGTWVALPDDGGDQWQYVIKTTDGYGFSQANPEGTWTYTSLFEQNPTSLVLPEYPHIVVQIHANKTWIAYHYIYDDQGAYDGAVSGDPLPPLRDNFAFYRADFTSSNETGPLYRMYCRGEGDLSATEDYASSYVQNGYDKFLTCNYAHRDNAGTREHRWWCTGEFDSGWHPVQPNSPDPRTCKFLLALGLRYTAGETLRGASISVSEYTP